MQKAKKTGVGAWEVPAARRGLPEGEVLSHGSAMRFLRLLTPIILVLAMGFVTGCASSSKKRDFDHAAVRFLLEAGPGEAGVVVRLPSSGTMITVIPKVLFTEFDVTNVEVMESDLGRVMLFHFTTAAGRDLYRQTVRRQGLRIVTTVNGQAVGAVRLDRPISQGYVLTHIEADPADFEKLAKSIRLTSEAARKDLEKRKK